MELVAIVSLVALLEYMFFAYRVGLQREKFGVEAPATTGNLEWERFFRVQQNTLEQLIIFLPAMWLCATYANALVAALLGVLFIVGRAVYYNAYTKDPASRTAGFIMTFSANVFLILGGLGGAAMRLVA